MKIIETLRDDRLVKYFGDNPRPANDVWELRDYETHMCIVKTHQNGIPTMNSYGGYNSVSVGSKKYITNKWNLLKRSKM